jgi:ATP adenylyltransferase/5',5'''-P-1,P-4-tetraphosphate phosphorylase II
MYQLLRLHWSASLLLLVMYCIQVLHLLSAAAEWFCLASKESPDAKWPLFLWNCLPRAGASQFHGHAQVLSIESARKELTANLLPNHKYQGVVMTSSCAHFLHIPLALHCISVFISF